MPAQMRKNKKGGNKRGMKNKERKKEILVKEKGITLVALVITTTFSYDENVKSSNNKGFLLQTI